MGGSSVFGGVALPAVGSLVPGSLPLNVAVVVEGVDDVGSAVGVPAGAAVVPAGSGALASGVFPPQPAARRASRRGARHAGLRRAVKAEEAKKAGFVRRMLENVAQTRRWGGEMLE